MIEHPLEPIIDEQCEVLILGSFPSVKSREISFYYGHPQNRFWKIIGTITQTDYETIEDKKKMLLEHHIAIWDIIHSLKLYKKYQEKETGIKAILLPSSSPANARYRLSDLVDIWKKKLTL